MTLTDGAIHAELIRKLDLLIALKVYELKRDQNQKEMVILLDGLGFKASEIAKSLGTTTTSVNPILSRARKGRGVRDGK